LKVPGDLLLDGEGFFFHLGEEFFFLKEGDLLRQVKDVDRMEGLA